jgi:hypothetical protein
MGIYAAPPNRRRDPLRASDVLNGIALILTVAALATFGMVGGGLLHSGWLAIALGEGLLALAFVICAGPSTRRLRAYSRASGTDDDEVNEAPDREARSLRSGGEPVGPHRGGHQPSVRRPVRRRRGGRPRRSATTPSDGNEVDHGPLVR